MQPLNDNHIFIKSTEYIKIICEPLYQVGVTYFEHRRAWKDDSRIYLSNNVERMKQLIMTESADMTDYGELMKANYILWQSTPFLLSKKASIAQLEKMRISKEFFNIDNGIVLVKKRTNYTDYYSFASVRNNTKIIAYYLTNLDFLKKFILFFMEKAADLLKAAYANKIYLKRISQNHCDHDNNKSMELKINKIFVHTESSDGFITIKEFDCLKSVAHGKSFKETARQLGISERSVEHYLYNARNKLNISTMGELINIFWTYINI